MRFRDDNVHLRANEVYRGKIHVVMSYCEKQDCSPSGVKQNTTKITIEKDFRKRETEGNKIDIIFFKVLRRSLAIDRP